MVSTVLAFVQLRRGGAAVAENNNIGGKRYHLGIVKMTEHKIYCLNEVTHLSSLLTMQTNSQQAGDVT